MRIRDLLFPRPPLRLPRRTVRLRLTAIYASLFLASGAGLLAITYILVREAKTDVGVYGSFGPNGEGLLNQSRPKPRRSEKPELGTGQGGRSATPGGSQFSDVQLRAQAARQHNAEMRVLLERSAIALGLMSVVSILLGWLAAGRVLRPLRTLTDRAREISATDLHKRLALEGPDDELKQLAGTFDDLLGRLEAAFAAQRQFIANASHELRTPLARAQTLAEVALDDPRATVDSLRASHRRVLAAGQQQERLIEALLTLARSERGLDHREPFDLAAITESIVAAKRPEAGARGLQLHATLEPAQTSGDSQLAERLIANLVDNALHHNERAGRVEVTTTTKSGRAILWIGNTGPVVPPGDVERLFEPFQRLGADRTDHGDGIGLGLSIVRAIANAHGASLSAKPRRGGGLDIEVSFPTIAATNGPKVSDETSRPVSATPC
jgi:signal transduction histidine kinase